MVAQIHRFGEYEPYSQQWFTNPTPMRGVVYRGAPGWGSFDQLVANFPAYSRVVERDRMLIPARKDIWDIMAPKLVSAALMGSARYARGASSASLSTAARASAEEHGVGKMVETVVNKLRQRGPTYSNSMPTMAEIEKLVMQRKAELDAAKKKTKADAANTAATSKWDAMVKNLYVGSTDLEGMAYPTSVVTADQKFNWNCSKYDYPKGGCKLRKIPPPPPDRPDVAGAPRPPGWRPPKPTAPVPTPTPTPAPAPAPGAILTYPTTTTPWDSSCQANVSTEASSRDG